MTTIPDDIMKAARECVGRWYQDARDHDYAGWVLKGQKDDDSEVIIIARALMAERERCASVARLAMINNPDADEYTCSICAAKIERPDVLTKCLQLNSRICVPKDGEFTLTLSRGPDNYYTVHSITGGVIE